MVCPYRFRSASRRSHQLLLLPLPLLLLLPQLWLLLLLLLNPPALLLLVALPRSSWPRYRRLSRCPCRCGPRRRLSRHRLHRRLRSRRARLYPPPLRPRCAPLDGGR